jgi:2-polyprenyl-3-methyl-5-hydroxy-6-metoxy-1,4-benzoquinol methylase
MSGLQALQRRLGFAGDDAAVRRYQAHFVPVFPPGARVLDVGCGEGVFLDLLRAAGRQGVGVDSSADDLAPARARGLEVVQDDGIAYLERAEASFDGVFCAHVIEHLPPEAAVRLLTAAHRALRPGGRLVLITPEIRDLEVLTERFWLDLTHVRPYPERLLVQLCTAHGFAIERSGNDPRSARGDSFPARVRGLFRFLRFGSHGYRGDVFVIARRI